MSTPSQTLTPTFADIPYAHLSPAQALDLYLPEGSGPFRLIVNVHGGAFMMGDKRDPHKQPAMAQVVAHGYALASVNYRLSGEALFPAQIQDVKAAVRWLRAHAADYGLNPHAFGAWGDSAGGHLVALLGASGGVATLEGADLGYAEVGSRVQAVVDWFGPIDFLQMDRQFSGTGCAQDHDAPDSPESRLIGAPIQEQPERARAASPLTYITPDAPPFLIQHGTADCLIPPQQSQQLYAALCAAIGAEKVALTYLEGAGHGGEQFINPANMKLVLDFFDRTLPL
jgi:acetyl esterase/lipase